VLGKYGVAACPYDPQTDFWAIAQAGEALLLVNLAVPGTDYRSAIVKIAKKPKKYFFAPLPLARSGKARALFVRSRAPTGLAPEIRRPRKWA
jgi:hypothetical protein